MDNYPVLNPDLGGRYIGGESVQQTLLAKAFTAADYGVSMVVKDLGQPQGEIVDGIQVWKAFAEEAGIPVFRFLYPRLTSILDALNKANADIYYQSCAGMLTGVVARHCRAHRRTFVFRLAHDSDCMPGQQLIRLWRDRKLYEYGLRRADLIAAQGERQSSLLRENYGLDSVPINMVVEIPDGADQRRKDIDILWINNLRLFKRPDLVVELALAIPDRNFTMIGGPTVGSEDLYEAIKSRAEAVPNLNFIGAIPYHQVNNYIERARVFVNTSDAEGFPNSFLQAWIRRVPVVSFFDPDGLIAEKQLGAVPIDLADMGHQIRELLDSDGLRESVGERSRLFVLQNYSPDAVVKAYENLLDINIRD
jgi:glycosyltransferase involved in cell wall biosynthesis